MNKLKPFRKRYRMQYLTFQTLLIISLLWGASPTVVSASSASQEEPSPTLICEADQEEIECDNGKTNRPIIIPLPPVCSEGTHPVFIVQPNPETQRLELIMECELDDAPPAAIPGIPMGGDH